MIRAAAEREIACCTRPFDGSLRLDGNINQAPRAHSGSVCQPSIGRPMEMRDSRLDGLVANDLGHELMLFDPERREVLVLNLTARFVWIFCGAPLLHPGDRARPLRNPSTSSTSIRQGETSRTCSRRTLVFFVRLARTIGTPNPRSRRVRSPATSNPRCRRSPKISSSNNPGAFSTRLMRSHFGDSWEGCLEDSAS